MSIDRRRLLTTLAAGAAGVAGARILPFSPAPAGASPAAGTAPPASAALPDTFRRSNGSTDWDAVRAEFDGLSPDWIHLASFLFVSHPRALRADIERYRRLLDSDPYWVESALYDGNEGQPFEAARRSIAGYVGGLPEEIAFTSNTTSAISVFYHGVRLAPGQEIVNSRWDHPIHHACSRYAAERTGASVRHFALWEQPEAATKDELLARIERAISPKTRILGLTWVYSSSGIRLPVPDIAEVVARVNRGRAEADRCLLFIDGVHGFGNQDTDAAKLGADFFAAGTHKWFFGPRGTGFLWGRKELWSAMRPTIPTFDPLAIDLFEAVMNERPDPPTRAAYLSPGGFLAYEHFFALTRAAEFHRDLGRDRIAARIAELNGQVREGLAKIPGVTLRTPRDPAINAGITCFEVAGQSVSGVVKRLAEKKIRATASPYAVPYARYAAGIMNRPAELDTALAAVRDLAKG
jgi:selenocysteine lyase/cysteine desulfurase